MTADLKAQLKIGADASGVETGVGKAKRSIASLGGEAAKAGKVGSDGLQTLGRVSASTARSIDRTVASLQLQAATFGKTSTEAKLLELTQRGATAAQLASARAALEQVASAKAQAEATRQAVEAMRNAQAAAARFGTLLATVGVAGAAALAGVVRGAVNSIDAFNDLADATGASIENISALDRLARGTGVGFDTVSTTLVKFNEVLSKTDEEGAAAARVIKALGLSSADLRRLDPAEALRQTAVALARFADDGDKARAVNVLFGKSVREVAPFLKDLAEASSLVATTSTATAREAEAFNRKLAEIRASAGDAARLIAQNLLPTVSALADEFITGMRNADGFIDALTTFGTINPFRSQAGNLQALREQFDDLEASRERYVRAGSDTRGIDDAIRQTRRQIDYLKELQARQALLTGGADTGDAVSRSLLRGVAGAPSLKVPDKPSKAADPFGTELTRLKERIALLGTEGELERVNAEIQLGKYGKLSAAQKLALQYTAIQIDQAKEEADAVTAAATARDRMTAAITSAAQAAIGELERLESGNQALREEIELIGADEQAQAAILQARVASARSLKEEQLARLEASGVAEQQLQVLQREIDLLREREGLIGDRARAVYAEGLRDLGKASKPEIRNTLADSIEQGILDGFRRGGSLSEIFLNELKAQFARTVLRPIIQPVAQGGNDLISALLGVIKFGGSSTDPSAVNYENSMDRGFSLARGTNYVPYDGMRATLHKGEAVVPARFNPAAGGFAPGGGEMKVIVNAPAGTTVARQEQRDGNTLEVWLDLAEQRVAASVASGTGRTAAALKSRGVNLDGRLPRRGA